MKSFFSKLFYGTGPLLGSSIHLVGIDCELFGNILNKDFATQKEYI